MSHGTAISRQQGDFIITSSLQYGLEHLDHVCQQLYTLTSFLSTKLRSNSYEVKLEGHGLGSVVSPSSSSCVTHGYPGKVGSHGDKRAEWFGNGLVIFWV